MNAKRHTGKMPVRLVRQHRGHNHRRMQAEATADIVQPLTCCRSDAYILNSQAQ